MITIISCLSIPVAMYMVMLLFKHKDNTISFLVIVDQFSEDILYGCGMQLILTYVFSWFSIAWIGGIIGFVVFFVYMLLKLTNAIYVNLPK